MSSQPTPDKFESTLSEIAFTKVTAFTFLANVLKDYYVQHWPLPTIAVPLYMRWSWFLETWIYTFSLYITVFLADCYFEKKNTLFYLYVL